MQMFLQHGYGVTMNAIVQAAGLTRKTVYARYNNKEALFVAVLRQLMRSAPESRPELDEHRPLEEALRSFILSALTQLCRPEVLAIRQLMVANRDLVARVRPRSEEHTSELQSLMRISYAVFCLKKKKNE